MVFTSSQFFVFLPIVLFFYFLIPGKWRKGWLLLASYAFYVNFGIWHGVIIFVTTFVTYVIGRLLEKSDKKRQLLLSGILFCVAVLFIFKYLRYFIESVNFGLRLVGAGRLEPAFSLVLPVGVSYYTVQIISYLADVYRGKVPAEKNFLNYALYVSFFPKAIMGPIERADNFMCQIAECTKWKLWDATRICEGIWLMLWGYFQKLVVADRLAIFVNTVDKNYMNHGTVALTLSATFYFFQIYADFLGYMNIARGVAKIMGFCLRDNFNAPYFAKSVGEYWNRWHMSFGTWLKDYVYIPLGGNRKGKVRKYINLMLTFLVSGFWHGASWNYVLWGGLHGLYRVGETALEPIVNKMNEKLHTKTDSFGYRFVQVMKMWLLNIFAFVLFKVPSATDALHYWKRMFTKWDPWVLFDGSLYGYGLSEKHFNVVIVALVLCFLVDALKYKRNIRIDEWLSEQCIWFRWGVLLLLLFATIILGAYGLAYAAENFIYFQF